MNANLTKLSEWTIEDVNLRIKSYIYAPINEKNHFARSRDEFVLYVEYYEKSPNHYGIVWLKDGEITVLPSPHEEHDWNLPVLLDGGSDVLIINSEDRKAWSLCSPKEEAKEVICENWCKAANVTEISTIGENGRFPIICRMQQAGEVEAADSFTFIQYDPEQRKLSWSDEFSPVFTAENKKDMFQRALDAAKGEVEKIKDPFRYTQLGNLMIKDGELLAFLEDVRVNPCGHLAFDYFWYGRLRMDGVLERKIWGKEKLHKLPGREAVRGKFSGDKAYLILSPCFTTGEWKGKQKLLRLSDCALIDIKLPRGYAKFRVMDVFEDSVFLSDEKNKLILCRMEISE